mgnify:CR=1 FL=1
MTIGRQPQAPIERSRSPGAAARIGAAESADDRVLSSRIAGRSDAIELSSRAKAIVRAGLAVKALVIASLETAYRKIRLASGAAVVLEAGLYRLAHR